MKIFAETQPTKQMTCYTSYPLANTWQVVPDPGPCYVGMLQSSIPFNCTIGGNVGQSATDGTIIGKYAGQVLSSGLYLISAVSDTGLVNTRFGCQIAICGANSSMDGAFNTAKIRAYQGGTNNQYYANYGCLLMGNNWYVPAPDELKQIFENRIAIGNFTTAIYWSSKEYNDDQAYMMYFSTGNPSVTMKGNNESVRCVRNF